jgi:hypothetical protein
VWVGSQARREFTPASIARGAFVCHELPPVAWTRSVADVLRACGFPGEVVARSAEEWSRTGGEDETELAVLIERRALWGTPIDPPPAPEPPVREQIVAPIVELARWGSARAADRPSHDAARGGAAAGRSNRARRGQPADARPPPRRVPGGDLGAAELGCAGEACSAHAGYGGGGLLPGRAARGRDRIAGSKVVRARPRYDRPRPPARRHHLRRSRADRRRPDRAGGWDVHAGPL